jgi:hypothetical protein
MIAPCSTFPLFYLFYFFIFDNDEKWFHLKVFYFSCGTSWVRVRSVWADFPKEYTLLFFYVAMLSCLSNQEIYKSTAVRIKTFFFFVYVRKNNNVIFVNIFYSNKKIFYYNHWEYSCGSFLKYFLFENALKWYLFYF